MTRQVYCSKVGTPVVLEGKKIIELPWIPAQWSVSELRNRLKKRQEWESSFGRTRQPYRDRGFRQKKEQRKERRRLTGGRDRWETRATATMMETRCRPLQYAKDRGKEVREKEWEALRRWGGDEDNMKWQEEKMRQMPTGRKGSKKKRGGSEKRQGHRQRKGRMKRKKGGTPETDFLS